MLARNIARLPAEDGSAGGMVFEPKWDGFRCIAFHDAQGRVELQSRQRRLMTRQFPDIARLVRENAPHGTVLDGELIIWAGGRLDFGLLQRRNAAGPRRILDAVAEFPAHYVLFDVLQVPPDLDVRARPLVERRALLEQLLAGGPPQLPLSPQTSSIEQAREWLETWPAVGVEGLVIKEASGRYLSGRRGWSKLRSVGVIRAAHGSASAL
jgi:ATP-dependent DNA ligase